MMTWQQDEISAGSLQSGLEATTDEDCRYVQARRRETIHNRSLGLDSTSHLKNSNDDIMMRILLQMKRLNKAHRLIMPDN